MTKVLMGKVALVTGGSRGIGAAVAKELAAQGATVAISYTANPGKAAEVVAAIKAAGSEAIAIKADQGDSVQVVQLVAEVVARLGKLDILVNNAGVFETGTIDSADVSRFERQQAINVGGVITAIREASRVMTAGGRIISMSSGIAVRTAAPGFADYASSKAAVEGYTKGAARDLGAKGITVNAIGVGSIDTDMNPADGPYAAWQLGVTAIGRFGRAEEIAAVVAFIASPAASLVTGAILAVDGGAGA